MKKTTLFNRIILTLIGFLSFLNFSSAQTITFGSSTVSLLAGAQYTCTGYFSNFSDVSYFLNFSQNGNLNLTGLEIICWNGYSYTYYLPGSPLNPPVSFADNNMQVPFTLEYSVPANAPCGTQSTITIELDYGGKKQVANTSTVTVVNQVITGNTYLCENTTNTYTLSQNGNMGSIAAGGEYTWSLTAFQAGWEINNHSVPVNTTYTLPLSTATSVSIKTPGSGSAGNATLTVNGANMCDAFSETITTELPEPNFSYVYTSACMKGDIGYPVTWTIKPMACATSYTWSGGTGGVILQPSPDGLSCTIAPVKIGYYAIHVVAKNSYTTSPILSATIFVRPYDSIHCNGK